MNIANPKTGFVGLHIAAQEGFCDIMELLLDHADTDINVQNVNGYTPLHSAAYYNRPDAVKMLLQRGADVRKTTHDGYTPIICASLNNSIDSLSVLLNHDNSDIDAKCSFSRFNGATALAIAAYRGLQRNCRKADSIRSQRRCHRRIWSHRVTLMWSIDNPGEKKSTDSDHFKVAELLIKSGRANVNALNFTADMDTVDVQGITPLHTAIANNNRELVRCLLNAGAKVNMANPKTGSVGLHIAARREFCDIMELLLDHADTDINVQNVQRIYCVTHCSLELVRCFLNAGAKVNIANPKIGFVGLHTAAQKGFCDIMELLLDHVDTDINVQNVYGYTPLHIAAYYNRPDAVKMLLQRGADVRKTTHRRIHSDYMRIFEQQH